MKKLWIIAKKDIGEAFRSRSIYVFILVMVFLTFSYVTSYRAGANKITDVEVLKAFSRSYLGSLAYTLPIMYSIFVCSIFANYSVILDKAKRNMESLLATPISVRQLWIGKSLAVCLPSVVIGLGVSILAYLVMNFGFVVPKVGGFIFPSALSIISAIVIAPILVFSVVMVVTCIQLIIANPRIASLVFTGIFILLVFGVNILGGLGISIDFFPIVYMGVILICAMISYILSQFLTKEKVLLSSKA